MCFASKRASKISFFKIRETSTGHGKEQKRDISLHVSRITEKSLDLLRCMLAVVARGR